VSCQPGLVLCDGACIDPQNDPLHCGAAATCTGADAGSACGGYCSRGTCASQCPAGQLACGQKCVDPFTDRAYCGASGACSGLAAGQICGAGEVCSAGACALSCPVTQLACGGTCIDPLTDRSWCGAVGACDAGFQGTACGEGELCVSGACTSGWALVAGGFENAAGGDGGWQLIEAGFESMGRVCNPGETICVEGGFTS
jgi:hypothetical protein